MGPARGRHPAQAGPLAVGGGCLGGGGGEPGRGPAALVALFRRRELGGVAAAFPEPGQEHRAWACGAFTPSHHRPTALGRRFATCLQGAWRLRGAFTPSHHRSRAVVAHPPPAGAPAGRGRGRQDPVAPGRLAGCGFGGGSLLGGVGVAREFPVSPSVFPGRGGPSRAPPSVASLREGLRPALTARPAPERQRTAGKPPKERDGGTVPIRAHQRCRAGLHRPGELRVSL